MTNTKKNSPRRHAKFTNAFKAEAVRLVRTSGRPLRAIADDLGVGFSTLGKWVSVHKEADLLSGPHEDTAKELARLRKETRTCCPRARFIKKTSRAFAHLWAVETGSVILILGGELPTGSDLAG